MRYEVYVGNIGCVYSGSNERQAQKDYVEYVEQSKTNYGRAAGENVTLFKDGEPAYEFVGSIEKEAAELA